MSALVESIGRRRRARPSFLTHALPIVAGSLVVAGLAQIALRQPFTPVPVTGQTLGVLLVGGALGARRGGAALLLYLAEGAVGLPFFATGSHGLEFLKLSSATGGYLWAFVIAALAIGMLSDRGWVGSIRSSIGAMLIGEIIIYAVAVPWLAHALDVPAQRALQLGLYPFVLGDTIKLLAAAAALPATWRLTGTRIRGPQGTNSITRWR
jgi:biotin transport system substrate-specific component